jgi:hypothetical protein
LFPTSSSLIIVNEWQFRIGKFEENGRVIRYDSLMRARTPRYDVGVGAMAPEIAGIDAKKNPVALSNLIKKNEYVLIDFLAESCGACRNALSGGRSSDLEALAYVMEKKLGRTAIIGVKMDGGDSLVSPNYSTIVENKGWEGPIFARYHINSLPTVFCIDKNGKIISAGGAPSLEKIWESLNRTDVEDAQKVMSEFYGETSE